jgi:hypothetical protein
VRRTRPTLLVSLGVGAMVVGFLLELALAASGRPVFIPPVSLPITLVAVAVIILLCAIPIRRATTGTSQTSINPFRALRIALLAKASSLTGVLVTGAGVGCVLYLLSRPVVPGLGSVVLIVVTVVGGGVLAAAGLVAEYLCTIPPKNDVQQGSSGEAS